MLLRLQIPLTRILPSLDMNATSNQSLCQQNSVPMILIMRTLILVALLAISSYDREFDQFYMGSENYPYLTSVIRKLSTSDELGPVYFSESSLGKAERGSETVDRSRLEIQRLRDYGNELFLSLSMFEVADESPKNKINHSINTQKIIDQKYPEVNEVQKNWWDLDINNYEDFFSTHDNNGRATTSDINFLDGGISFPLDGSATTLDILSWFFDFNYLRNHFHDPEIKKTKVHIFLKIHVNDKLLNFPGGNLIIVELSRDSNPVSHFIAASITNHILYVAYKFISGFDRFCT